MCDTISELDKKNDIAHKALDDKIEGIKKDMATKEDINELKPKIEANSTISGTYKIWITVLLGILALMATLTAVFMGFSYSDSHKSMDEQIKLNKILTSINKKIEESNAVAKNFNAKAIMDTLANHWKQEQNFYNNEYLKWRSWTKRVYDREIRNNTQINKEQEVLLKDHELRIERLEKVKSIIK